MKIDIGFETDECRVYNNERTFNIFWMFIQGVHLRDNSPLFEHCTNGYSERVFNFRINSFQCNLIHWTETIAHQLPLPPAICHVAWNAFWTFAFATSTSFKNEKAHQMENPPKKKKRTVSPFNVVMEAER